MRSPVVAAVATAGGCSSCRCRPRITPGQP